MFDVHELESRLSTALRTVDSEGCVFVAPQPAHTARAGGTDGETACDDPWRGHDRVVHEEAHQTRCREVSGAWCAYLEHIVRPRPYT